MKHSFQPFEIFHNLRKLFITRDILGKSSFQIKLPSTSPKGILGKFKWFFANYLMIVDDDIGWLPFALIKGLRIINWEDIDIIFSTSGTKTSHLVGFFLKKITGNPWIADFRDFWIDHPKLFTYFISQMGREKYMNQSLLLLITGGIKDL